MLLQAETSLPDGSLYELTLDGYRVIVGRVVFVCAMITTSAPSIRRPRRRSSPCRIEVVALDESAKPSVNLLQHAGSSQVRIVFYVFDLLVLAGRDVMGLTLKERRSLLETKVLPQLEEPVRYGLALGFPTPTTHYVLKPLRVERNTRVEVTSTDLARLLSLGHPYVS